MIKKDWRRRCERGDVREGERGIEEGVRNHKEGDLRVRHNKGEI